MRIYKGHTLDVMLTDSSFLGGFDLSELQKVREKLHRYYPEFAENITLTQLAVQQDKIDIYSLELLLILQYLDRFQRAAKHGVYCLAHPFSYMFLLKILKIPKDITQFDPPDIANLPNEVAVIHFTYKIFLSCMKTITKLWRESEEKMEAFASKSYVVNAQQSAKQYFFAEKIRLISELNYLKGQYEKNGHDHKAYHLGWVLFSLKNEIKDEHESLEGYSYEKVIKDMFTATFQIIDEVRRIYHAKPFDHFTYSHDHEIIQYCDTLIAWLKQVMEVYFADFLPAHIQETFPDYFQTEDKDEIERQKQKTANFLNMINPVRLFSLPLIPKITEEELQSQANITGKNAEQPEEHPEEQPEEKRNNSGIFLAEHRMHLFPSMINPLYRDKVFHRTAEITTALNKIELEENRLAREKEYNRFGPAFLHELKKSSADEMIVPKSHPERKQHNPVNAVTQSSTLAGANAQQPPVMVNDRQSPQPDPEENQSPKDGKSKGIFSGLFKLF